MGYTKHALKGISWLGGIRVIIRVLSFVKTLIIARILTPSQFGVFGIATLILALIEIITETGINVFLVQKKESITPYINTAWIVSILRGIIIAVVIALSSPFVATFFHVEKAVHILLLVALVPLVRGFINPSVIIFFKELQFHKQFMYQSSLSVIESVATIGLTVITHDAASLVWGLLISAACEVVLSFAIAKPRPSFVFELERFKEIIRYGRWITVATVANYFYTHGDDIAVGRILGTASLGLYDMAYRISLSPLTDISDMVTKVTFPVYVKISEDKDRLRTAFYKTFFIVTIVVIPIGLLLFFFPKEIIVLALGSNWLAAAPALQVLGIFGIVRAISSFSINVFLPLGRQDLFTYITIIGLVGLGVVIVPFTLQWGIVGAGYAALFGTTLTLPFIFYHIHKQLR